MLIKQSRIQEDEECATQNGAFPGLLQKLMVSSLKRRKTQEIHSSSRPSTFVAFLWRQVEILPDDSEKREKIETQIPQNCGMASRLFFPFEEVFMLHRWKKAVGFMSQSAKGARVLAFKFRCRCLAGVQKAPTERVDGSRVITCCHFYIYVLSLCHSETHIGKGQNCGTNESKQFRNVSELNYPQEIKHGNRNSTIHR